MTAINSAEECLVFQQPARSMYLERFQPAKRATAQAPFYRPLRGLNNYYLRLVLGFREQARSTLGYMLAPASRAEMFLTYLDLGFRSQSLAEP